MPQIVETDIGDLEFPDDYTREQMRDILRAKLPSLRERIGKGVVRDLGSRFPRDVATSSADTIMGAARGWQQLVDYGKVSGLREMGALAALNAPVGEESAAIEAANAAADAKAKELEATREQRLAENPVYKFGQESKINAQQFYQTNPTREGSIPAMLSQGVASTTIPLVAGAVSGPLAPFVAGGAYAVQAGEQGAQEAIAFGHPDKADEAFILFAGLGALSEAALGYPIWFLRQIRAARQSGVDPAQFGRSFMQQVGGHIVKGIVREGPQEGTEQFGQNVIAGPILGYDPNRPLMQGVPQAAGIGSAVGGGVGGVGGAAMAIDQARARRAAEAQIPALLREQQTVSQFFPPTPEQRAAEAEGLPIPLSVTAPKLTAEQIMAEEAAATAARPPVEPYFAETTAAPEPSPEPSPRRRSPAPQPEPDRPYFKPPPVVQPAPTEPSGRDLTAVQPLVVEAQPIAGTPTPLTGQPEAQTARPNEKLISEAHAMFVKEGKASISLLQRRFKLPFAKASQLADEMVTRGLIGPSRGAEPRQVFSQPEAVQPEAPVAGIPETKQLGYTPQETPNAVPISRSNEIPPSQTPEAGQEVVTQVRDAERPAVPQTETPQAQGQVAKPRKQSQAPQQYGDLIEYIEGAIGKIRGKKTAPAGTEGYYGEGYKEAVGLSATRNLFSATGQTPDAIVQSLRDARRVPDSFSVDDLWDELTKNAKDRKGNRASTTKDNAAINAQEKAHVEFANVALGNEKGELRLGTTAIPVSDLVVGDTMEIDGHKFTVKDMQFNSETDQLETVELEDGRKFGVQWVGGQEIIHADAGTVTQAPVEFVPPSPAAPQAKTPKLGAGENQGDLISSTQSEDFALVGEKGTDFEKQARDKAKAEKEAAEAKATQDRKQGTMFSVTLREPPASRVTAEDIERAFPATQGFSAKQVAINWPDGKPSVGYLVGLPNGQLIVVDPTNERLAFDPKKAAVDWGLDPATVTDFGIARGKWTKDGATINGLQNAGLIELINTAGPDTLSHEKFHALFELALTPEDRSAILNRYRTEEKAAEAFRRSEGFTRSFWEKMKRFIEWLANLVRGDAFRKLRLPLSAEPSQPTGRTEPQYSLEEVLRHPQQLAAQQAKPITSADEAASLQRQAGAGAGLVPGEIVQEIASLNPADRVEGRVATRLNFVLQLHGVAPAIELQTILADLAIPDDQKQAAISNVLNQITHVRSEARTLNTEVQAAVENLESVLKKGGKITGERMVAARAKRVADNLITGYRAYLTAQAASLPANQNIAAARASAIRGLEASVAEEEKYPDQMRRAVEAIAARIDELPVAEGPQAVIDAIRSKNILKGKISDTTIDLLTAEVGGMSPLLLNPTANKMLTDLADLQKKADTYAKQIETVEKAFSSGDGKASPVQLRKFAETYRQFRNRQTEAAKAIREYDKDVQKADEDVRVYERAGDILTRLEASPEFQNQLKTAIERPGGEILKNIYQTGEERKGDQTQETVFISPLTFTNLAGERTQNTYRIRLAPTREADEKTIQDLKDLKEEIDLFLDGENGPVDPLDAQTWRLRRDHIEQFLLNPKFHQEDPGGTAGNPFQWGRIAAGGMSNSLRGEMETRVMRATDEVDREVQTAEKAGIGYRLLQNNKEFGDAATTVAITKALKSHNMTEDDIRYWNQYILDPIIAAGQAAGQMRLRAGNYIPGTNIQITPEDMEASRMQKRWSSGIVQTTQGTASGLPAILRKNPVLISDEFSGKPVLRGALSPGPLTMARSFSSWGRRFDVEWSKAATPEARRALVNDGENFQMAARGYVATTNPEFQNNSPLKPVYEQFAKNAADDPITVNSFDQLVDELAEIAVAKGMWPTKAEALPEIGAKLMEEIEQHVAAIRAQYAEDKINKDVPQTVAQFASAQNAFTKARKKMVAPDPYYDYTLTHDSDRISFVGAGYQLFQMRIISALKALQTALEIQQTEWDAEISNLSKHGGLTEKEATRRVEKKTSAAKRLGTLRLSYEELVDYRQRIDKMVKQMEELVIDVRDPTDSNLLKAADRLQATLSSGLLANPTAIANNLAGGLFAAKSVTLRNLGMSQSLYNPKAHGRMVAGTVTKLLRVFRADTPIGKLARSNLPVVKDLAGWVNDMILEQTKLEADAERAGLRTTTDMRNRLRARGELKSTAGSIEYKAPSEIGKIVNTIGSLPGVRYGLGHLRDKIPKAFDEYMNERNARFYQDTIFLNLKVRAIKAFEAREQMAARAGLDINDLNDFTREANLLKPQELRMPKWSGYRDSGRLRHLFNTVGSLDKVLLDYYNRWKAAPAGEKADVPLFPDSADEFAVIHNIEAHENLATSGFTPLSFQGVGQRGLIKKILFMFKNYPTRMFTQMARLLATDPRDPKYKRTAYAWWSVLTMLIISAIAGMLGREVSAPVQQALTGRTPSTVKLSNVLNNPDAGMIARYIGMGLAGNLPYYGGVISQILGNPGYGTWLDASEYIPVAGLAKDAALALKRTAQTGDPLFPAVDFAGRWFPPVAPLTRLLPGVEGDIEARNASRALRVVGPSAGMELAGGGGAQSVQTPASAAIRRLMSAAYSGDREGIQAAFDEAVREKTAQGSPNPERAVLQSLASREPARAVFGRQITPAEEAQLTGLMSGAQRKSYAGARSAFNLINETLGTRLKLSNEPRARTRGQATRRALFSDISAPARRSRRRRLGGRRRSPFGRLQIRGASRRRRRSPARTSFAA